MLKVYSNLVFVGNRKPDLFDCVVNFLRWDYYRAYNLCTKN